MFEKELEGEKKALAMVCQSIAIVQEKLRKFPDSQEGKKLLRECQQEKKRLEAKIAALETMVKKDDALLRQATDLQEEIRKVRAEMDSYTGDGLGFDKLSMRLNELLNKQQELLEKLR